MKENEENTWENISFNYYIIWSNPLVILSQIAFYVSRFRSFGKLLAIVGLDYLFNGEVTQESRFSARDPRNLRGFQARTRGAWLCGRYWFSSGSPQKNRTEGAICSLRWISRPKELHYEITRPKCPPPPSGLSRRFLLDSAKSTERMQRNYQFKLSINCKNPGILCSFDCENFNLQSSKIYYFFLMVIFLSNLVYHGVADISISSKIYKINRTWN